VGFILNRVVTTAPEKIAEREPDESLVETVEKIFPEEKKKRVHWWKRKKRREELQRIVEEEAKGTKFSAMPNRGTAAAATREELTEFKADFASRWDKTRLLAEKFFGRGSRRSFTELFEEEAFQKALVFGGKKVKKLGGGEYGEAFLYETEFLGEKLSYVVKSSKKGLDVSIDDIARNKTALQREYVALSDIQGDITPTAYGMREGNLYMEYMPGKTLKQLKVEGAEVPSSVYKEVEEQAFSMAQKGYYNLDIKNLSNVLFDPETRKTSWIDFGLAGINRNPEESFLEMQKNIFFTSQAVSSSAKYTPSPFGMKFSAMPNRGSAAAEVREQLTEFKKDFASRWDSARKIAVEIFGGAEKEAFGKLRQSEFFREAIKTSVSSTEGKLLGKPGVFGEVRSYTAGFSHGGKDYSLEFAVKRLKGGANDYSRASLRAEAKALEAVGEDVAPSLYGMGKGFGVGDEAIVMEKFHGKTLERRRFSKRQKQQLREGIEKAHQKGISHMDLHTANIMEVETAQGKQIGIIDWGLSNRISNPELDRIGGVFDIFQPQLSKAYRQAGGVGELTPEILEQSIDTSRAMAYAKKAPYKTHGFYNSLINLKELMEAGEVYTPERAKKVTQLAQNVFELAKGVSISNKAIADSADLGLAFMKTERGSKTLRKSSHHVGSVPFTSAQGAGKRHSKSMASVPGGSTGTVR